MMHHADGLNELATADKDPQEETVLNNRDAFEEPQCGFLIDRGRGESLERDLVT